MPVVVWVVRCDEPRLLEALLHAFFKFKGKHAKGDGGREWFYITCDDFVEAVVNFAPDFENGPASKYFPV